MNAYWKYQYNSTLIEVKNSTTHAELVIDGKQVDTQKGLLETTLNGSLPSGEKVVGELKAGFMGVIPSCEVKVNGEIIKEVDA